MKKIYYSYVFCIFSLLLLHITHGFPVGKIVYQVNIDNACGEKSILTLLGVNIAVILLCLLIVLFVTIYRRNTIKYKWIIALGIVTYSMFLPIIKSESWGGAIGVYQCVYISFIKPPNFHIKLYTKNI